MPVVHRCSECSYTTNKSSNLKAHMRKHTGEQPFACPVCDKAFSVTGNLKRHMLIHQNIKPHECNICGRKFREKGTLTKHYRTHTGERPYVCSTCGKGFTSSSHLTRHKRIHTGDKLFQCKDCNKCFTTSGYLKVHRCIPMNEDEIYHEESASRDDLGECEYTCPLCNEVFKSLSTRNRHTRHCVNDQQHKPISPQKRDSSEPEPRSPKRARLLSHSEPSSSSTATAPPPTSASLADPHPCLYCSAVFPSPAARDAHELTACRNRPH